MTLTQQQKDRFTAWQGVIEDLTTEDLEASNWNLFNRWNDDWEYFIRYGPTPGLDVPPNKPPHP